MATLAGQRAQFTYALNQYNLSEDPETRMQSAKTMAKYIVAAPNYGFTADQITRDKNYPAAEVAQYVNDPSISAEPDISEAQALQKVEAAVDLSDVKRIGEGEGVVYAYGYACCLDRLKVGSTAVDTVQRIADQISTSTPDKPVLFIEIRTNKCRALERAIQATLETRGRKISGGGTEWFKASREEVLAIYQFIEGI
jgi:T5orf172 domain-containing protein